jgi:hypothetical protein
MAEMAAHEAMAVTPPPTVVPAAATPAAPEAARPANGRATEPPAPAPPPAPPVAAEAQPSQPHAAEPGRGRHRPSSEFDALERDFFAREADLYKQDHPESFDDLEHGHRPPPGGPNRR